MQRAALFSVLVLRNQSEVLDHFRDQLEEESFTIAKLIWVGTEVKAER